jgi:hypothetical protein
VTEFALGGVMIGADRDPTPIDFFDCLYGVTAGTCSDLTLCRFTHEVTNSGSDRAQLANMAKQVKAVLKTETLEGRG